MAEETPKLTSDMQDGESAEALKTKSTMEFFSDPEVFEFLAQRGDGQQSSKLSRQSLYFRFDPLVERRKSIDEVVSDLLKLHEQHNSPTDIDDLNKLISFSPSPERGASGSTDPTVVKSEANSTPCSPDNYPGSHLSALSSGGIRNLLHYHMLLYEEKLLTKDKHIDSLQKKLQELQHELVTKDEEKETLELQKIKGQLQSVIEKQKSMIQVITVERDSMKESLDQKEEEASKLKHQVLALESERQQHLDQMVAMEMDKVNHLEEISRLTDTFEKAKLLSTKSLKEERDQAKEELQTMEKYFSSFHNKYERLKSSLEVSYHNAKVLEASNQDLLDRFHKQEEKYRVMKELAEKQLRTSQNEAEIVINSYTLKIETLQAKVKKEELRNNSLQVDLQQKHNENETLRAMCDELLSN